MGLNAITGLLFASTLGLSLLPASNLNNSIYSNTRTPKAKVVSVAITPNLQKLLDQAEILKIQNKSGMALKLLQKLLEATKSNKDLEGEALTYNLIGDIYHDYYSLFFKDSNQEEAKRNYQRGLAIAQSISNLNMQGKALLGIGFSEFILRNYDSARNHFQKVYQIALSKNDEELEFQSLRGMGVLYGLGFEDGKQSILYLQKALAIAQRHKKFNRQGAILHGMAATELLVNQHPEESLQLVKQGLKVVQRSGGTSLEELRLRQTEIDLLQQMGLYHLTEDLVKWEAAKNLDKSVDASQVKSWKEGIYQGIQAYHQAISVAEKYDLQIKKAQALRSIATLYSKLSDFRQAAQFDLQALTIYQAKHDKYEIGQSLRRIALDYSLLAKNREALKYYLQAFNTQKELEILNKSPYIRILILSNQFNISNSISDLYSKIGMYEESLDNSLNTLKIGQILNRLVNDNPRSTDPEISSQITLIKYTLPYDLDLTCYYIQRSYEYLGRTNYPPVNGCKSKSKSESKTAHNYGRESQEKNSLLVQKQLQYLLNKLARQQLLESLPKLQTFTLLDIANAYEQLGQQEEALKFHLQNFELSKKIVEPSIKSLVLGNIASYYAKRKQYTQALQFAHQSINVNLDSEDIWDFTLGLKRLGGIALEAGKLDQAETALRKAVQIYQSQRANLRNPDNQMSIYETQSDAYRLLQEILVARRQPEAALEIAERGRARAFIELFSSRLGSSPNPVPIEAPNLTQIQEIAKTQNATLVEYSLIGNQNIFESTPASKLLIWVVRPTGTVTLRQVNIKDFETCINDKNALKNALSDDLLRACVENARRSIFDNPKNYSSNISLEPTALQQLHKLLIEPIVDLLPTDPNAEVVFLPQGSLFLVPFNALQDSQGRYLIEQHTIRTAPAIQALALTHQQQQRLVSQGQSNLVPDILQQHALVVGNPVPLPSGFSLLRSAEQEANIIANILKTKVLIGREATELDVKKLLPKVSIIHFATHGKIDEENGSESSIVLAPSNTEDGLLKADEILDFKLNADLVVLSACETGKGNITGDGVVGLSRSFIAAGTASIIVSLWSVPDEATQFLMTKFYQNLYNHTGKAQALRQAMLSTLKQYNSPYSWAAFTLIGESE